MTDASEIAAQLRGVLCATVTPFDPATLAVDWQGVHHNVEWLVGQGIELIVVNGSIGEPTSLTEDEQRRLIRETVRAAAGRLTIVAGCSDPNPQIVIDRANDARAAGAAGILVAPPGAFRLSPAEIVEFFAMVDRGTAMPLVVYDNPAVARSSLTLESIDALASLPSFAGLKEADPDILRFEAIVDRFEGRFPIIAAVEDPLLYHLVAGARACMTASAAFAPATLRALLKAVTESDLPTAHAVFARIRQFRALFASQLATGRPAWLPYTKAAVDLVGGRAGPPRPPLQAVGAGDVERLARVLADIGVTHSPSQALSTTEV
ncbi:MAG: dihydrodipicolinate synthase family protein [Chloroflexi bacterium]|nr:dihydrodipicolinate synthase family protein [Chloroflexota bacterium]